MAEAAAAARLARRRGRKAATRFVAGLLAVTLAALVVLAACRPAASVRFHADGQPPTLAEWQLFTLADGVLAPNADVVPYELNTPLFTDYAHKLRTVWMPEGQAARYQPSAPLDFPVGTILGKTFYYPRLAGEPAGSGRVGRSDDDAATRADGRLDLAQVRLIETRLLVHRADGWVALAYVWNDAQTEARLMRSGALVPLTLVGAGGIAEEATYAVPDANQCAGCHVSDLHSRELRPIGPTARNLNRELDYAAADGSRHAGNQLQHWQDAGRLLGAPAPATMPRLANWRDADAATLDARARAYLDANCAHCHSAVGPGKTSGLWLGSEVADPLRLGRCKLPIAAGQGTGDRRYGYVPGDPEASVLSYRLESNDPGVMMPELGRSVVHREGAALIRAWIAAQDGHCGAGEESPGDDPGRAEEQQR